MKLKPKHEQNELVEYIRWYGKFKSDVQATAWLDEYLRGWRYEKNIKINYQEIIGED